MRAAKGNGIFDQPARHGPWRRRWRASYAPPVSHRTSRVQALAFIDTFTGTDFPRSRRIYLQGQHPSVRVPMREIQLSLTLIGGRGAEAQYEDNEPCRSTILPVPTAI